MNRVKYFASYNGPSYGTLDQEYVDAEQSLHSAVASFWRRNVMQYDDVSTYRENADGVYVPWEIDVRTQFPGTDNDDHMELFHAVWSEEDRGYVLGDWAYRLSLGPRKGVRVEKV